MKKWQIENPSFRPCPLIMSTEKKLNKKNVKIYSIFKLLKRSRKNQLFFNHFRKYLKVHENCYRSCPLTVSIWKYQSLAASKKCCFFEKDTSSKYFSMVRFRFMLWGHSFNTYAKFYEKLIFLAPRYVHVRVCIRGQKRFVGKLCVRAQ